MAKPLFLSQYFMPLFQGLGGVRIDARMAGKVEVTEEQLGITRCGMAGLVTVLGFQARYLV
jgi:hypothetical protein